MTDDHQQDRPVILAVDDAPENLDVLRGILTPDHIVLASKNGEQALKIARSKLPDLILLDVMMPGMDGYEVCRRLKSDANTAHIPVLFVSAMTEDRDEEKGFAVGAVDYISKPVKSIVVRARVRTHLALSNQQKQSRREVELATSDLRRNQQAAIEMLGEAGHYHDTDTGKHIWRMAEYTRLLAAAAGWSVDAQEMIRLASPMHDTGKIGIADAILKAPRKLEPEEFRIMQSHTRIGYDILIKSDAPLFRLAAEIALAHHEKWDGSGYPLALKGEQIPESARIVAVADVFDALTMKRPYKDPWPLEDALNLLRKDAGSHFDPRLVDLFLQQKDEVILLMKAWADD